MAVVTLIFGIGILACTVGANDVNAGDVRLLLAIVIGITGMGIVGAVLSAKAPQNPLGPAYQVAAMFMALAVAGLAVRRAWLERPPRPPLRADRGMAHAAGVHAGVRRDVHRVPPVPRRSSAVAAVAAGDVVDLGRRSRGRDRNHVRSAEVRVRPWTTVANPFQMGPEGLLVGLNIVGGAASFLGGILAVISVVVRFRRSQGDERQQLRWLAWAAVAILVCGVALVLAGLAGGERSTAFELVFLALVVSVLVGLPLATAIAVLRYRLYDLDLVVKKTAIYSIVAIALTALYLALLGGATLVGLGPIPAGVVFLLTFTFARNRARKIADRIVYGKRATPFEVLSEFSERVGETYSVDDVLPRMTQLLAAGTGAREARAWIRHGRTLRASAVAPADAGAMPDVELGDDGSPAFGEGIHVFPVTHQGELLGAITLAMAANDPMDASKERLAQGVASQAGLALRNVRLVEDLRASRRRIVTAQDERAKALERNIHDGAQQQLVALTVRLRLAEQMAERDPAAVAAMLGDLRDQASAALEDLRDLARGVYPPLLADKGLFPAVEAQARKAAVPVTVQPGELGRYPPPSNPRSTSACWRH